MEYSHDITEILFLIQFDNIFAEYTFYWLIREAGLPPNISSICTENANNSQCEIFNQNVVHQITNLNIYNSCIGLVVLR
jgi:hypothetical protein